MKKAIAKVLTVAFAVSMLAAGHSALALTYTNPDPLTIVQGDVLAEEDAIRIGKDYGTISAVKSSDNGIVRPGKYTGSAFEITAIKPGTVTLNITSYTKDQDGYMTWHSVTMTVVVVTDEAKTAQMGADSDIVLAYGQKYTDTSEGYYQIIRYTTSSNTVATGSRKVEADGTEYPQIIAGQRKGECTISFFYRIEGQSGEHERKMKVTVVAPGDATAKPLTLSPSGTPAATSAVTPSGSNAKTASASVSVGKVTEMQEKFYKIETLKTSDDSVATANTTGTAGSMGLAITGIAPGTATVSFDGYTSSLAPKTSYSIAVTVTGEAAITPTLLPADDSDTSADTTSSETSDVAVGNKEKGVYLSVKTFTSAPKKSFYAAVWIDGQKVVRTAEADKWATLRWVSSDTKIFTVNSQTGKITTVAKGSAKLICVNKDGTSCDAMTIVVK